MNNCNILWLVTGILGFATLLLYDYEKIRQRRFIRPIFWWVGLFLIGFSTWQVYQSGQISGSTTLRILGIIICVIGNILWFWSIFIEIPARKAYWGIPTQNSTMTRGTYSLCRHPGVLWYGIILLGLYFQRPFFKTALVFSILFSCDVMLAYLQELIYLRKDLPDYDRYLANTPFLIPKFRRAKYFLCGPGLLKGPTDEVRLKDAIYLLGQIYQNQDIYKFSGDDEIWLKKLRDKELFTWVAYQEQTFNHPIATCSILLHDYYAETLRVGVVSQLRNLGIGSSLCFHAHKFIVNAFSNRIFFSTIRATEPSVQSIHIKLGYRITALAPLFFFRDKTSGQNVASEFSLMVVRRNWKILNQSHPLYFHETVFYMLEGWLKYWGLRNVITDCISTHEQTSQVSIGYIVSFISMEISSAVKWLFFENIHEMEKWIKTKQPLDMTCLVIYVPSNNYYSITIQKALLQAGFVPCGIEPMRPKTDDVSIVFAWLSPQIKKLYRCAFASNIPGDLFPPFFQIEKTFIEDRTSLPAARY